MGRRWKEVGSLLPSLHTALHHLHTASMPLCTCRLPALPRTRCLPLLRLLPL